MFEIVMGIDDFLIQLVKYCNCWIHDGRNYKKLRPVVSYYQKKLEAFLDQYWDYYAKLCNFKMKPDAEVAKQLDIEFDQLFSTETVYDQLDDRISKTCLLYTSPSPRD